MNSKFVVPVAFLALAACASQVDPASTEPAASLAPCSQVQRSSEPTHIRLITDLEYVNLVRDALQITLVGTEAEISNGETPAAPTLPTGSWAFTENLALHYQTAAQNVARQAVDASRMQALMGSVGGAPATDAQLNAFLDTKVAKLWNRPVAPVEARFLKNIYNGSAALADGGAAHAFDMLLQAVLQAPSFVYRTETSAGGRCQ
jgi:hypothetical protein